MIRRFYLKFQFFYVGNVGISQLLHKKLTKKPSKTGFLMTH